MKLTPLMASITGFASFRGGGGAAPAPPDPAVLADVVVADVPGAVHHDAALLGQIVDARVQAPEAERVAVASLVGVLGEEQAEAGLPAVVDVREVGGVEVAAPGSVRHQLVEEHLAVR